MTTPSCWQPATHEEIAKQDPLVYRLLAVLLMQMPDKSFTMTPEQALDIGSINLQFNREPNGFTATLVERNPEHRDGVFYIDTNFPEQLEGGNLSGEAVPSAANQ